MLSFGDMFSRLGGLDDPARVVKLGCVASFMTGLVTMFRLCVDEGG